MTAKAKIFLFSATVIAVAIGGAVWASAVLALVHRPAVIVALAAGVGLAGAFGVVLLLRQEIGPLRRLAKTISEMAERGELQSDFPSAGGNGEVHRIEETIRRLLGSLEESQDERERSYVEALGAVVAAADARDHETAGHSFRVAHYAIALAKRLGLEGEELKAIEWGGLLHDVGKMAVPDEILRKVGPLSDREWSIMRQHPGWGFEMLADIRFLQKTALQIVYSHHERWDGEGYPSGLAGEEIPLAARVFAVVDSYDAMTSDRPYRRAGTHHAAVMELERVAGRQLDPQVVQTFRRIPEMELRRLREHCESFHTGLTLPPEMLAPSKFGRIQAVER